MNSFKTKPIAGYLFCTFILLVFTLTPFVSYSQGQSIGKDAQKRNKCLVPFISSEYIHTYKPQGDVFSELDAKNLKAGEYYPNWQPNDHCLSIRSGKRHELVRKY